jgi:hypothetical protein
MKFLTRAEAKDLTFVKKILARDLKIKTLTSLCHDACNTYAYDINGDTIVKFPTKEKQYQKLLMENKLLNAMRGKTCVVIPNTKFIGKEYIYSVHKKIIGDRIEQLDLSALSRPVRARFARDIAEFLYDCHGQTSKIMNEIYVPYWDRFAKYAKPSEMVAQVLGDKRFAADEKKFIKDFYKKFVLSNDNAIMRFSHFDVMPKNIAFDYSRGCIAGIYDFGDSGYGDIHHDFSQVSLWYNFDTLKQILSEYEKLSGLKLDAQKIYDYSLHSFAHFYMQDKKSSKRVRILKEQIGLRV